MTKVSEDGCKWLSSTAERNPQFLAYCHTIDVPKVNKHIALWLAVDQTAQDLAVWDSLLTTTEALVSQILSLVSNLLTSKQGAMEIEAKPATGSWFSGTCSAVASSSQSQNCFPCVSFQAKLTILNKPTETHEVPVVAVPEGSLAMLQHVVPTKFSTVESKEKPLVFINCDHPVLSVDAQEMIKQYFLKHCCVQLLETTSRRTQREIFITKDLRFKASLGLAFRAKLRVHILFSGIKDVKVLLAKRKGKSLKNTKDNTNVDKLVFIRRFDST
ncbi:hypothetical protein DSO57_1021264 [Entomophthora muscae]|uniref:Uncharacterized protein n=1 Tax=Entomophthora muscae TaxID=34485 RepID=A0ACC2RI52_9FUNG|nr:hypothetical protein DSO57_1021264 [Entomophthora muscae]